MTRYRQATVLSRVRLSLNHVGCAMWRFDNPLHHVSESLFPNPKDVRYPPCVEMHGEDGDR